MPEKIDLKKTLDSFSAPRGGFRLVEVPDRQYLMVDGHGDPNTSPAYTDALAALYPVAYRLKFISKRERDRDYVVPPLEGFWWQDGVAGVDYADKSSFHWISVIRLPDFVTKADFDWAVETASKKKKLDCSPAEFRTIDEGLCVQIMHIGSYDAEPASVAQMDAYLAQNGYENDLTASRLHHEIYLSDPRKTALEKQKTVIRHPIKVV